MCTVCLVWFDALCMDMDMYKYVDMHAAGNGYSSLSGPSTARASAFTRLAPLAGYMVRNKTVMPFHALPCYVKNSAVRVVRERKRTVRGSMTCMSARRRLWK
jgi:hypothetical protein